MRQLVVSSIVIFIILILVAFAIGIIAVRWQSACIYEERRKTDEAHFLKELQEASAAVKQLSHINTVHTIAMVQ